MMERGMDAKDNDREELPWWKKPKYSEYNIDGSQEFWLPPDEVDPEKFKPRRLDPDEYDVSHTALTAINKWMQKVGPERLRQIVGAVDVETIEDCHLVFDEPAKPRIYREYADHWACEECKDKGDKWYMQEHRCSGSKVTRSSRLKIKQEQRRAARIAKLQKENQRIDQSQD